MEGLCKKNPSERLNCSEVIEILRPAEEAILNLEEFEISEVPSTLKNKLELNQSHNKVVQPTLNNHPRSSLSQAQQQTPVNLMHSPGYSQVS